jgi:hypothetical protein
MIMKKHTVLLIAVLGMIASVPLFALTGQVVTVTGKVEIQANGGVWKAVKAGDTISAGSMISTGFKSEATIKLGASVLTIKPLTRMTLTELVEKEDTVNTELYLEVGNVTAEVNSLNNKRNGFSVKSPVATASVRGTVFEFGDRLVVHEGSVLYISIAGQTRMGKPGQTLEIVGQSIASPGSTAKANMNLIQLSTVPSTEVRSPILATLTSPTPTVPEAGSDLVLPVRETITAFDIQ